MESRFYTPLDYEIAASWWIDRGLLPVPEVILPPLGAVALIENEPVAMSWVYLAGRVSFVAHAVAMPGLNFPDVSRSLILIGDLLKEHCAKLGVLVMMMAAPKGVARYAIKHCGFVAWERPVINMACNLEVT